MAQTGLDALSGGIERMNENRKFVIFDLDGTITKRDTYLPFLARCLIKFGIRNFSLFLLPFHIISFKIRVINNHTLKEKFLKAVLRGINSEAIEPVANKFVTQLFQNGINWEIVNLLKHYKKNGQTVILASASFDFYVKAIAEMLKINKFACTRAEIRDHRITGRIKGQNCYGNKKMKLVSNLIGSQDPYEITVFTDHYSDLPLLRIAHIAYLVHPGYKTKRLLYKNGYKLKPVACVPKLFSLSEL